MPLGVCRWCPLPEESTAWPTTSSPKLKLKLQLPAGRECPIYCKWDVRVGGLGQMMTRQGSSGPWGHGSMEEGTAVAWKWGGGRVAAPDHLSATVLRERRNECMLHLRLAPLGFKREALLTERRRRPLRVVVPTLLREQRLSLRMPLRMPRLAVGSWVSALALTRLRLVLALGLGAEAIIAIFR
jgi:hypothetical protein